MTRKTISCILVTLPFSALIYVLIHTTITFTIGHRHKDIYPFIQEGIIYFAGSFFIVVLILKALKLYERQAMPFILISIVVTHLLLWYSFGIVIIHHK